jgi:hypothetical protein
VEGGDAVTASAWWRELQSPPAPLAARERGALIAATIVAAISRFLAMAKTPWDWDEFLFMLSLGRFDVSKHHPHPPGFPLYVATAKLLHALRFDEFHSFQIINVAASIAIVPATFWLARELRLPARTSLIAALMLAFFPNVWFYGGTAFSDVPSMTLVIVAVALLFRGCRHAGAFVAGAMVLGVAAGYRPQNLVIGFVPFAIAAVLQIRQSVVRVIAATLLLGAIVVASYGTAAWLTGWQPYRDALAEHREYIVKTDSYQAPGQPSLPRRADSFFVSPFHAPLINTLVTLFAFISGVVSLVRRRMPIVAAIAAFAPFCLFAWLMLDRFSTGRFSIGYAPLVALLVADGIVLITRRALIADLVAGVVIAVMTVWTWPLLRVVRTTVAPTVAAVQWARAEAASRDSVVYVDEGMIPMAEWALTGRLRFVYGAAPPSAGVMRHAGIYVREGGSNAPGAVTFSRPRARLWNLVRRRYFEVSVTPAVVRYGNGWYSEEGEGATLWRWMSNRSVTILPPLRRAQLVLAFYIPLDVLGAAPTVTLRINGNVVDQFMASQKLMSREITVDARDDATNELVIETSRTVNPAAKHLGGDTRDLGLRVNALGWMPVK